MITIASPELLALLTRLVASSERQANALEAISFALQTYGAIQVERDAPEFVPFAGSPASEAPAIDPAPIPEPQTSEGYTGMVKAVPREEAEAWWQGLAQKGAERRAAAAAAPGPAIGTNDPKPWDMARPAGQPAPSAAKASVPWEKPSG